MKTDSSNIDLQRKLDQQALKAIALKYDLKPSQVRAVRAEIRAKRKEGKI